MMYVRYAGEEGKEDPKNMRTGPYLLDGSVPLDGNTDVTSLTVPRS